MKRFLQLAIVVSAFAICVTFNSTGASSKLNLPPGWYSLLDTVVLNDGTRFLAVSEFLENDYSRRRTVLFQGRIGSDKWVRLEAHSTDNNLPGKLVVKGQQVVFFYNEGHSSEYEIPLYYKVWNKGRWSEIVRCPNAMPESVAFNGDLLAIAWQEDLYFTPFMHIEAQEYPKVKVMVMNLKTKRHWKTMLTPDRTRGSGYEPFVVPSGSGFDVYCTEERLLGMRSIVYYHVQPGQKNRRKHVRYGFIESVARAADGAIYFTYRDEGNNVYLQKLDGKSYMVGSGWFYSRVYPGEREIAVIWHQLLMPPTEGHSILSRTFISGGLKETTLLVERLGEYGTWDSRAHYGHPFLRYSRPDEKVFLIWEDEGQILERMLPQEPAQVIDKLAGHKH